MAGSGLLNDLIWIWKSIHHREYTLKRTFINYHSIHLQSVRDLCKFGYCRLLVHKFLFIQIPELGAIKTNTKIGAKHPLTILGVGKRRNFNTKFFCFSTLRLHCYSIKFSKHCKKISFKITKLYCFSNEGKNEVNILFHYF